MVVLFSDERLLTESSGGEITLTTHRICKDFKEWGRSYNQSIMLEHITSCENAFKSQIWLLILGVLFFIGGLISAINNNVEAFGMATLLAVLCAGIFLLTKSNLVTIGSPSTKMLIKVNGMKREQVLDFINKV